MYNEYEKKNGLREREDLGKVTFNDLTKHLTDKQFHNFYSLIWDLDSKNMLSEMNKDENKRLKDTINDMKMEYIK